MIKSLNHILTLCICFLLAILLSCANDSKVKQENYQFQKILLGKFEQMQDAPVLGKHNVRWWDIEGFQVAVDSSRRVYVLDIYAKRVLVFSLDGSLLKTIMLDDIDFPNINKNKEDGYTYYMIQVSPDGEYIYVTGGKEEYNWFIFDSRGAMIKKNVNIDVLFSARCMNGRFIGFYAVSDLLDAKLNVINHLKDHTVQGELYDTASNAYEMDRTLLLRSLVLKKRDASGVKIWEREIKGYKWAVKILGVDGSNNIYVLMGGPHEIVKINSSGQIVGKIILPKDMTDNAKMLARGSFLILCDDTVYFIPPISSLDKQYQKTFLKMGEYAIYQFERIK